MDSSPAGATTNHKRRTKVDGQLVSKGEEAAVREGTRVRVGGVLSLEFLGEPTAGETDRSTILRDP